MWYSSLPSRASSRVFSASARADSAKSKFLWLCTDNPVNSLRIAAISFEAALSSACFSSSTFSIPASFPASLVFNVAAMVSMTNCSVAYTATFASASRSELVASSSAFDLASRDTPFSSSFAASVAAVSLAYTAMRASASRSEFNASALAASETSSRASASSARVFSAFIVWRACISAWRATAKPDSAEASAVLASVRATTFDSNAASFSASCAASVTAAVSFENTAIRASASRSAVTASTRARSTAVA